MRRRRANRRNSFSPDELNQKMQALILQTRIGIRRFFRELAETLEPVLKPLFAINQTSASIRSLIFVAGFILWVSYAYIVHAPDFGPARELRPTGGDAVSLLQFQLRYLYTLLVALAKPLFESSVFRFVLVISFSFWLTSRVAAIYLADIYELPDLDTAVRFIRQASFISNARQLNHLVIKEAEIPQSFENSPIYQIGGPGMVLANLENVVVFEKVDGAPDTIAPTGQPFLIEGFERLRKIIDLRDQFIENEQVTGRTKDGIPVTAKGIRFSFSVQRDTEIRSEKDSWGEDVLQQPLSFVEESIHRLVYEKPNKSLAEIGSDEVKAAIRDFIANNTLSQFLADSRDESNTQVSLPSDPTVPFKPAETVFKDREKINQELITSFKESEESAIDLHWISVGTWVPPEEIPKKHKEAWQRRLKSQAESTPKALTGLLRSTKITELLRLIQDVPINAFGHIASQEKDSDKVKRELMLAYREKIKNAYGLYKKNNLTPPASLVAALKHLQRL
jgi:hypothetical protein